MIRLQDRNVSNVSLGDWISWRKRDCGLQELREWVGDQAFLQMLSIYCGEYLKFPPSKELLRLALDLELASCVDRIRIAKKAKDLDDLVAAEQQIVRVVRRLGRNYAWGVERGRTVLKQLRTVEGWKKDLALYRAKHKLDVEGS